MCLMVAGVLQLKFSLPLSSFDNALLKIPDFTVSLSVYVINSSVEVLSTRLNNINVNNVNANFTRLLQGREKKDCDKISTGM